MAIFMCLLGQLSNLLQNMKILKMQNSLFWRFVELSFVELNPKCISEMVGDSYKPPCGLEISHLVA